MTQIAGFKGASQALTPKQSVPVIINPVIWLTLLGGVFRFAGLGSVRLTHDLAWQGWEAARIVNGVYPLIGQPSSVFLDNPPLMGYIQAIPLFLWRSPWSIFIFITLLNTLAIPFIYSAVDKTLGRRIAILATALFVINPWIVHFSRFTWTQGLLPFFLAVMFWSWAPSLCSNTQSKRSFDWVFLAGWVALTAMCMTYVLAFAMLAPVGLLMVIFWKRLPKKELAIGVSVLVLAFAFYGWAVSQNLDQNSGKFFDFLNRAGETEQVDASGQILNLTDDALTHALRFVTGRDYVGRDINGASVTGTIPVPFVAQLARWGLSAAFLAGLITLVWKRSPLTWFLLIWFFVPIGLMMILPSSVFVHPHYLLFTLPAGGIIAAVGLDWGMQQHKNLIWFVIVFLFLIGMQFFDSLDQSRSKAQQNPYVYGLDAMPLRTASEVGRQLRHPLRSLDVQQYPIRIVSDSTDQMISAISATWVDVVGGLDPFEWSIVQSKSALIYLQPSEGGFEYAGGKFTQDKSRNFIFPDEKLQVSELDEYLAQGLDGKPKFSRYVVHYLLTVANSLDLVEQRVDLETDAGFGLLGYSINQLDEVSYQIKTYWRVDTLHDARNEWFVSPFIHLINDEGATVANVAPHGQWGHRWRVGDVYVSTVTLDRPADAVQLGIGLFDPISGRTFLLNAPDGNVARFEVDLP